MSNTANKTNVNIKKICIWGITSETQNASTFGSALDLTGRARSFTDTPTVNKAELYGSGKLQETILMSGTGNLTLAVNYLTAAERAVLFSENTSITRFPAGVQGIKENSQPKLCAVAIMTECTPDGSIVNLYKYLAVTFQPNEETVAQIEGNSINYSTVQITGNYRKHRGIGYVKSASRHVDTTTSAGQTLVNSWFTTPGFIGTPIT